MSPVSVKEVIDKLFLEIIYLMYIYKKDLALINLQWLMCYKSNRAKKKKNKVYKKKHVQKIQSDIKINI